MQKQQAIWVCSLFAFWMIRSRQLLQMKLWHSLQDRISKSQEGYSCSRGSRWGS